MLRSPQRPVLTAFAAFLLLAAAPAWPQDAAGEPAPAGDGEESAAEAAGEAGPDEAEAEDGGTGPAVGLDEIPELDEQTYEEDDDDFIPSEEIPVDQSIPFPTDI